jgi:hypothetical protein
MFLFTLEENGNRDISSNGKLESELTDVCMTLQRRILKMENKLFMV